MKRRLSVNVVPGEPTDGSGRICIHLFVRDERGPVTEPCVMYVGEVDGKPRLMTKPTRGRLACDPKRLVAQVTRGGVTAVTPRTDDPRAVTCPKCKASKDYERLTGLLTAAEAGK